MELFNQKISTNNMLGENMQLFYIAWNDTIFHLMLTKFAGKWVHHVNEVYQIHENTCRYIVIYLFEI